MDHYNVVIMIEQDLQSLFTLPELAVEQAISLV